MSDQNDLPDDYRTTPFPTQTKDGREAIGMVIESIRFDPMDAQAKHRGLINLCDAIIGLAEASIEEGDPVRGMAMYAQVLGVMQVIAIMETDAFSDAVGDGVAALHRNMHRMHKFLLASHRCVFNQVAAEWTDILPPELRGLGDLNIPMDN